MMTTTLEVAKRAGISKTTVSRVLSGNGCAGQETKDRVFRTVEGSGYRPSLLVRNLSAKSTQTLRLVITNTLYRGIYFSELLLHAARMAGEKGRQLSLADGKHSAEEERRAIQYLLDLCYDATMIYPHSLSVDEIDDITDAHSQPIMVLNRHLCENSSHSVWCDHKQTSFNAAVELITAGYQEIVLLIDSTDSPAGIEHPAGYKDALAQHGIAFNGKLITSGKWTPANSAGGVGASLECGVKFSVLVVSNGNMAIGTIKALHECGIAVPEQVSVIRFDDIAIASCIVPALSGVKIPVAEMIQEIIGRLISMFDGGDLSPSETFSKKLIRRGSLTALSR